MNWHCEQEEVGKTLGLFSSVHGALSLQEFVGKYRHSHEICTVLLRSELLRLNSSLVVSSINKTCQEGESDILVYFVLSKNEQLSVSFRTHLESS